jgi:hypothetical protein
MQQVETRKQAKEAKGLSAEELEAHSRVELLPDRLEMHRRLRHGRGHNHGFGHGHGFLPGIFVFIGF